MLTERKKADRANMIRQVASLAIEYGAKSEVEMEPTFLGKRASIVRIFAAQGVELSIDFDGESSQPNTFVLSWVIRGDSKFSRNFAPSANTTYFHKSTDVCEGFDCLLSILAVRLTAVRDGWAFQ